MLDLTYSERIWLLDWSNTVLLLLIYCVKFGDFNTNFYN